MKWTLSDENTMPAPALIGQLVLIEVTDRPQNKTSVRHVGVLRYFSYRPGVEFVFAMDGVPHLITVLLRNTNASFTIQTNQE